MKKSPSILRSSLITLILSYPVLVFFLSGLLYGDESREAALNFAEQLFPPFALLASGSIVGPIAFLVLGLVQVFFGISCYSKYQSAGKKSLAWIFLLINVLVACGNLVFLI